MLHFSNLPAVFLAINKIGIVLVLYRLYRILLIGKFYKYGFDEYVDICQLNWINESHQALSGEYINIDLCIKQRD